MHVPAMSFAQHANIHTFVVFIKPNWISVLKYEQLSAKAASEYLYCIICPYTTAL